MAHHNDDDDDDDDNDNDDGPFYKFVILEVSKAENNFEKWFLLQQQNWQTFAKNKVVEEWTSVRVSSSSRMLPDGKTNEMALSL